MFDKRHYITIGVFALLFVVLYFGFDTKPEDVKLAEKSRANSIESTNIQNLLQEARTNMRPDEMGVLDAMFMRLESAESDSAKISELMNLSSAWYSKGYFGISGYYAEEIAKMRDDEMSWSITGTTYARGISNAKTEKERDLCASKSREAIEKAISINPENLNHKINLAVTYAEKPTSDNPMRGIMMLLEMDKENPDNVSVLYQLARFGLQTNQVAKAISRLERALSISPDNQRIICLISEAYERGGNAEKASLYKDKCELKNKNL